ncbi:RNA polymerase sigma factor [Demequina aestuarii]|uniref:RNA polymerase sigma factor n=1 Tax=Demequina aestuarii TaxID=327095 RepID=UPI000782DC3B|nr:sigma-70 family RNA polymerase sigma factor [Demequina aestuarii]
MTTTSTPLGAFVDDERAPTAAEVEAWQRDSTFLPESEATPDRFPALYNMSAAFMYRGVIRPVEPERPDYVTISIDRADLPMSGQLAEWNMLWEAGQFRRRVFSGEDLSEPLARIADLGDINAVIVPRTESRYFEYAPIYHLLPAKTLHRFGLPLLRKGQWPFTADHSNMGRFLTPDFADRLAKAWAWTVWPHLVSGSGQAAFSNQDPIRLLAHNLDFWVPPVTDVIQDTLASFPEVDNGQPTGPVTLEDGTFLEGATTGNPRKGGPIWTGEEQAGWAVGDVVEAADHAGRLRGILDAVRSNRVEEDFSPRWSYAREDFERKLYRKRNRVKVRFVELTDAVPVQSPDSDLLGNIVTSDFLAVLNDKEREIVVLLASGYRQHEIAERLGYANHSPIAKRLARIRKQAEQHFDLA